ncbi:hypothetical protein [Hydrocarboniphaga sp.]|uniref:hypothetical protein n=1 Tax=Hydrocarboniphaga sp. TaxID=2033016 RepID=UPI003D13D820
MSRHTLYAAAFALALATLSAYAEPPSGVSQRKPPPEAYSACVGKSAGDKVTLAMHEHTMEATCEKIGDQLAARPARLPDGAPPEPQ